MDFSNILQQLRQERQMIEQAIQSLEQLAGSLRGTDAASEAAAAPRKRGRPKGSKNRNLPLASSAGGSPQV